jgi:hypothetical protein
MVAWELSTLVRNGLTACPDTSGTLALATRAALQLRKQPFYMAVP